MAGRNLLAQPAQEPVQPVVAVETTAIAQPQGRNLITQQAPRVQAGQQQGLDVVSVLRAQAPAIGEAIFGTSRQTPESQGARELIDAPIRDIGAKLGFNLALNFNADEIEQVVKQQFGENSVRKDEQGNSFVTINNEEFILNKPGLSKQDLGATIANVISFLPAAKVAALGQTIGKRLGIGAIASGTTQAGIETGEAATGGEFSPSEVAAATVFGGIGEIPGAIMQAKRLTPDAAKLLPQVTPEQAATAKLSKERTGISQLPSQASQVEQDQLVNVVLARDPNVGAGFTKRLKEQSQDAFNAVTGMMDLLATSDDAARAALDVRNSSKEAINAARKTRTAQTSPLFSESFSQADQVKQIIDTGDITAALNDQIDLASGPIKRELLKLRTIVKEASSPSKAGSNVQKLWNAKKAIFNLADQLKVKNAFSKDVKTAFDNTWAGIRDKAVDEVPGLREANDLHIELSPPVDLVEGSIGTVANISDDKLSQVRRQLFDWQEHNASPQTIRNAKTVIEGTNPDAWNALLRNKMQQDLAEVGVETASEAMDANFNFVQQFWSKSLKGRSKALMMQALDGDAKKNFNAISDAFQRTRIRPQQSATKQLANIEQNLAGGNGVPAAIDSILNPNSAGIFQKLLGSPQVREQNVKIISDIILDPNWMDRMSEIRKLGMKTPAGGAAFAQLFRDALTESEGTGETNQ